MSHACAALEVAPVVPRCATVTSSKKLVCLWKEGDWLVLSSHDDNLYAAHGCWLPQCRWRRWQGQLVDGVLLVSLWKVFPGEGSRMRMDTLALVDEGLLMFALEIETSRGRLCFLV